MNVFDVEIIESRFLPDNIVMLKSGDTITILNTKTGEIRSGKLPDLIPETPELFIEPGTDEATIRWKYRFEFRLRR